MFRPPDVRDHVFYSNFGATPIGSREQWTKESLQWYVANRCGVPFADVKVEAFAPAKGGIAWAVYLHERHRHVADDLHAQVKGGIELIRQLGGFRSRLEWE